MSFGLPLRGSSLRKLKDFALPGTEMQSSRVVSLRLRFPKAPRRTSFRQLAITAERSEFLREFLGCGNPGSANPS